MAYFHKGFEYHEDMVKKRALSEGDREFLLRLQKEMNTQDTTGTADPRYWAIKGSRTERDNEQPDDYALRCDDGEAARGAKGICEYLNENLLSDTDFGEAGAHNYRLEAENSALCSFEVRLSYQDDEGEVEEECMDMSDLNYFLGNYGAREYEVYGIKTVPFIYPNTMFLTQKEAEEHLRANHYHYSDDAHTYCMVAWRSPDVERLWKILQEVTW